VDRQAPHLPQQAKGRKLRLKWFARVFLFFGFLLCQLLRNSRIVLSTYWLEAQPQQGE